jgi:hypothetical protein
MALAVAIAGFVIWQLRGACTAFPSFGDIPTHDLALDVLRACPAAEQALGAPIERTGVGNGSYETRGAFGTSSWRLDVKGPLASGSVAYGAEMHGGVWTLTVLQLEVGGERLDVLACADSALADPSTRPSPEALARATASCDRGAVAACNNLGVLHAQGRGVPKDLVRAAALYQKACDGGAAIACTNVADLLASGEGVAGDDLRAAGLYLRACDAGEPNGCRGLGVLLAEGRGVGQDLARARTVLDTACKAKIAEACTRLESLPQP